jgi:hypothetical protein
VPLAVLPHKAKEQSAILKDEEVYCGIIVHSNANVFVDIPANQQELPKGAESRIQCYDGSACIINSHPAVSGYPQSHLPRRLSTPILVEAEVTPTLPPSKKAVVASLYATSLK